MRTLSLAFLLIAAAGCSGRSPVAPRSAERPRLLLVTIDTMRADRLGRGFTPTLDDLAARGMLFANARSTVPLTLPAHVSILTGTLPTVHGVRENGTNGFGGRPHSVARRLAGAGYRTAAFVGAYVLDRRFGLADGFDQYDDQIARDPDAVQKLEAERPAAAVVDRALAFLGARGADAAAPWFMWVHLYDPHAPYTPPPEFLQRTGGNAYDGEVAYADAQVARLLAGLQSAGERERTVVVVAGDHGESLGEHGERTHGILAYEPTLRVPLIVAGPGIVPAHRMEPVSLVDVAPTLLARAGLEAAIDGARDLLSAPAPDREIYAETEYPRVAGWSPLYALVQDRWKLIVSGEPELYDLSADPVEQHNLATARASTAAAMGARIDVLRKATAQTASARITPEVTERLRALGYVASSVSPATPGAGPNPSNHIAAWGEFEHALADLSSGNRPRALARLQTLAAAHQDAPVMQSTYARVLADSGSTRAALAVYRRAVARWPTDAALYHDLAVAARDAGEAVEAMRAEEAALALDPALPSAHNGRGLLLTDAGRHVDAALAFERAVHGDPTNASYWVNLGNARRAAGDMARAADAYRQAASVDPRSPDAANGLGVLLVQQNRAAEAVSFFERALEVSPMFTEARLNLGIAYQQSGQQGRAVQAYREVLARARAGSPERRAATDLLRSLGQ